MSALAIYFIAVGIADICRRLTDRRWLTLACGPALLICCALLSGLWHLGDVVLVLVSAAAIVGWILLSRRPRRAPLRQHLRQHRHHSRRRQPSRPRSAARLPYYLAEVLITNGTNMYLTLEQPTDFGDPIYYEGHDANLTPGSLKEIYLVWHAIINVAHGDDPEYLDRAKIEYSGVRFHRRLSDTGSSSTSRGSSV